MNKEIIKLLIMSLLFLFLAEKVIAAHPVKVCGGKNQRACCALEKKFGACRKGLKKKSKRNAGWCKAGIFGQHQSQHICIKKKARVVKACGSLNQRACCLGETRLGACDIGFKKKAKRNSGWCRKSVAGQFQSQHVCVKKKCV